MSEIRYPEKTLKFYNLTGCLMMQDDASTLSNNKKRKFLMSKMFLKSLLYAFAIFGFLMILLLLSVIGLLRQEGVMPAEMPEKAAVVVDFDEIYTETLSDDLWREINGTSAMTFHDLRELIRLAGEDDRVQVLIGRVGVTGLGLAQIQEVRQAIKDFRAKGKKAYLYSRGFSGLAGGTDEYYLATAFDEIWMQPHSDLGITGLYFEVPFIRGLLNKIGVQPEFYARHEYKNAMASVTDKSFSEKFRQEINKLGGNLFAQVTKGIASDRGVEEKKVLALIDQAPLSAETALEAGLIDRTAYWEEFRQFVSQGKKLPLVSLQRYGDSFYPTAEGKEPKIALLVLEGAIAETRAEDSLLESEAVIDPENVARQLREIGKQKNLRALVVRLNSPGGSYTASNAVWHALKDFKEKHKVPVIMSMGDYAASGGYFIALAGDHLMAEPGSITGSIGVLGGKMVLKDLWRKLDVNWGNMAFGKNAGILSSNSPFSKSEKEIFNKSLDSIYSDFTLKVSEARKLSLAEVDKVARGRVWSGEQALEKHLVDALGGLEDALNQAADMAALGEEAYQLLVYPKSKSFSEKLAEFFGSAPLVSVSGVTGSLGLDSGALSVLQQLQYDMVLYPFKLSM